MKKKRVSRDEWLNAGLETLADTGIESVKIERLAHRLGVAKSGFYWHFRDRQALLEAMLDFWKREYTAALINNPKLYKLPAAERLLATSEVIAEDRLGQYELAIAGWARNDEAAGKTLKQVYAERMAYVGKAFRELGFSGNELEMRTRLFVCYSSSEEMIFGPCTSTRDRNLRKLRIRLLTQPPAASPSLIE